MFVLRKTYFSLMDKLSKQLIKIYSSMYLSTDLINFAPKKDQTKICKNIFETELYRLVQVEKLVVAITNIFRGTGDNCLFSPRLSRLFFWHATLDHATVHFQNSEAKPDFPDLVRSEHPLNSPGN